MDHDDVGRRSGGGGVLLSFCAACYVQLGWGMWGLRHLCLDSVVGVFAMLSWDKG